MPKTKSGPSASEWMSVPEAARLRQVAESSVREAINKGRLKGGKMGAKHYIVLRRDVEAWEIGTRGPKKERG